MTNTPSEDDEEVDARGDGGGGGDTDAEGGSANVENEDVGVGNGDVSVGSGDADARDGDRLVEEISERSGGATGGSDDEWRLCICNPKSGAEDHLQQVEHLAAAHGFEVWMTEHEEHAVELACDAAEESVDLLAVAGGDGTLHEVVQGLVDVDALDDVPIGVLPSGTENIFAGNIGVPDIETGFEVLESGERRRIDVGFADEEPFVMSCIAGLPAEASVATSGDLKSKLGSLAFLIEGFQEAAAFDGLSIEVTAFSKDEEVEWEGEALCALVGNIRRFAKEGGQANVEDGLFEAVIIEQMPPHEAVTEATVHRLMGDDTENVLHFQASQLEIVGRDGEPINFSLDGERRSHERLVLHTKPRTLTVCVGEGYEPEGAN